MDHCWQRDRWRAALSALLDGEASVVPHSEVEAHLASCSDCADWYAQAGLMRAALARVATGPDLTHRLIGITEAHVCGCHRGELCRCTDCQCATCTCRPAAGDR